MTLSIGLRVVAISNGRDDVIDFVFRHIGMHRQAQDFSSLLFRNRKITVFIVKLRGSLLRARNGIVDLSFDPTFRQLTGQLITAMANDVSVENRLIVVTHNRNADNVAQRVTVTLSDLAMPFV